MAGKLFGAQTGWGMDWGEFWGGDLVSFDFESLCARMIWKHLEQQPNVQKVCEVLAEIAAETDASILFEAARVGIDQAVGGELDDWGAQLNLPRRGAADELYRRGIKAAARAMFCQAEPAAYYDIVDIVTATGTILLLEQFPACFRVFFFGMSAEEQQIVGSLIGQCRGLGICALGVFVDSEVFEWDSTEGSVTVEHHWGSTRAGSVDPDDTAGFASVKPI